MTQRFTPPTPAEDQPIRFEIEIPAPVGGWPRPGRPDPAATPDLEPHVEQFEVTRELPVSAITDYAISELEHPGSDLQVAKLGVVLRGFLGADWARFVRATDQGRYQFPDLQAVMRFLVSEAQTPTPTMPSSDPSSSAGDSETRSTDGSDSVASPPSSTDPLETPSS